MRLVWCGFVASLMVTPSVAGSEVLRVVVPVADVRSEPQPAPDTYIHDPLQETQLVFGETVVVSEIKGDWARVTAPGQWEYTHHQRWEGYPGWVLRRQLEPDAAVSGPAGTVVTRWESVYASARGGRPLAFLPAGSRVRIVGESKIRYEILYRDGRSAWIRRRAVRTSPSTDIPQTVWKNVRAFLGTLYYWGGLSPAWRGITGRRPADAVAGVDCSGLTHLAYRQAGVTIPRDSHEQWMAAEKLRRRDLRRGDLVFLANAAKPGKVVHVAMYVGGEYLIEGPGTGLAVRRVTFKKKLGRRLSDIENGDRVGEKIVYFGRPSPLLVLPDTSAK